MQTELAVVSVMALLFLATILSVVTGRLRLPFAVTLVGVSVGLNLVAHQLPMLQPLTTLRLSNDLVTYVLLPTLVFHAAFSADLRQLGQNVLPVAVLAIPSMFVSFLLSGLGLYWSVGVPLATALLFGAMVSATDSSAMLTIFRDLGAPKRLTVLAEGESLFNDAVSIVLFQVITGVLVGTGAGVAAGATIWTGAQTFVWNFAGGLLIGAALGWVIGKVIEIIENDDLVEILLTTTAAYLVFFAAQSLLHVSGVMAVTGTGLVLGSGGLTKYSQATVQYLERFWQYLAFTATSLMFLLIGLTVSFSGMWDYRGPILWGIAVATLARGASIYGLFPLVNRLPNIERVDARYQTVMVWGGLRGAVTIALALSLPNAYEWKDELIALASGVVLFNLLVQALTLEPLIRWLGLQRVEAPEQFLREEKLLESKNRARARISELRSGGMFSESVTSALEATYHAEEQELRSRIDTLRSRGLIGSREEFRLLKREYLLVEKRVYQDLFHRGQLSEKVLHELHHSIELQLDHLRYGGSFPAWTIHSPLRWKIEAALSGVLEIVLPWSDAVQRFRLNRIADLYEQHWGRLMATQRVLDELDRMAQEGSGTAELMNELRDLYRAWHHNARRRLDSVGDQYPEFATKVQEIMAARLCLQAELEVVDELERLDVLPDRDARAMRDDVRRKLRLLRRKPLQELRPRPRELLAKVPFFRTLPPHEFDRIADLLRARTFLGDDVIVREGDAGASMFLIGRGVVRVTLGGQAVPLATLLAGDFFGEMAVLSAHPRTATVTAVTHCSLYELTRADLEAVQIACPSLQAVLEATVTERAARLALQ